METTLTNDFSSIYEQINKILEENPGDDLDDWESEGYVLSVVNDVCEKYNVDPDDYWKWMIYENKSNFKKKSIIKNNYNREEVINTLKFFVKDTRGDKPWVDADDEWVNQNLK